MIQVVVIPANPALPTELREIEPDLTAMQAIVGGYIEVAGLLEPLATMYINEEGKLMRLPLNQRATAILQRHNPAMAGYVVGDVFICGVPNRDGKDTSCPDEYLRLVD